MEPEVLKSKIEAVLFITSRAMHPDEIAQIIDIDVEQRRKRPGRAGCR